MTPRLCGLALACAAVFLVGCGNSVGPQAKREMQLFALAYHEYHSTNGKSPAKLDDLKPVLPTFPKLAEQIRNGEFLVTWRIKLRNSDGDNSGFTMGYHRGVPESGGLVILANGQVVSCTAVEFRKLKPPPTE
jgi:hypothetical protein